MTMDVALLGAISMASLVPFLVLAWLVYRGRGKFALGILAALVMGLVWAGVSATSSMGIDPLRAIGVSIAGLMPALIGGIAGALVGWLLRRRS